MVQFLLAISLLFSSTQTFGQIFNLNIPLHVEKVETERCYRECNPAIVIRGVVSRYEGYPSITIQTYGFGQDEFDPPVKIDEKAYVMEEENWPEVVYRPSVLNHFKLNGRKLSFSIQNKTCFLEVPTDGKLTKKISCQPNH